MPVSRPTDKAEVHRAPRARMTGAQRRLQLIEVARGLFAERGFEGTSIEEIAQRAGVSKPIVYEHFGGKEGLYAVVVDREMETLLEMVTSSLTKNRSLYRIQQVALALLTYMEERTDGFRILVRGERTSSGAGDTATYGSLLNDAISQVEHILAGDFERRGFDPKLAPLYAQALVGMVSVTAQWWLDVREPPKEVVAAHLVNLCWNGLTRLDPDPELVGPDYVEPRDRTTAPGEPTHGQSADGQSADDDVAESADDES
ncbi:MULTISPECIES: TetR family transcriptional regulator [unclassified Gordonia (in: high G+C Gram-positive bacteria)]